MILAALSHYGARKAPPLGYAQSSSLGFELVITGGGTGCRLHSLYAPRVDGRVGWQTPSAVVPNMTRSNNPPPLLACDNAGFVLARPKGGSVDSGDEGPKHVARAKQQAFVQLLRDYQVETGDSQVEPYLRWVDLGMPELDEQVAALASHAAKRLDLDVIAIRPEEAKQPLHESPAAHEFWARRSVAAKGSAATGVCLVCGEAGPLVDTLPQALQGRWIPGTSTAQVALASVNFPSAARGASGSGLKSAPICAVCAGRVVGAFNDLAASPKHSYRLSDGTAAMWWATDNSLDEVLPSVTGGDADQVRSLLDSIREGRKAARPRGQFYLLVFSGNVARLVIRRWLTLEISGVEENIRRWFRDIEIADRKQPYRTPLSMARALGPYPVGDRGPSSPEGSFEALLFAALTGALPPRSYLPLAVARAVAEAPLLDDEWLAWQRAQDRLAAFRIILNRNTPDKETTMGAHLDETRDDPAYLSGRIFALSHSLQRTALGDVNASIVDRFFARAIQSPASVDGTLAVLQSQHVAALKRKGRGPLADRLDAQLGRLKADRGEAPRRLGIEEQAAWVAGFYQQREAIFQAAEAHKQKKSEARDDASTVTEEG